MKKTLHVLLAVLALAAAIVTAHAADYTTYLTAGRGFTEVTAVEDIIADAGYYYLLTPAETNSLVVGIGTYEGKPDWASGETKALRYKSVDVDPVLDLSNFFTIERDGDYIGLRNAYFNTSLFQTHDNAGYMYVLTYTEADMSDWCYLTPTYQNGYWLFESGKYPISSNNWACGYLGPWNKQVAAGEAIALNRRNTEGDEAGHYRLWKIEREKLAALRNQLWASSLTTPADFTWLVINPSFETGDETGWTLDGKDSDDNVEFKTRDYGMTNKQGNYLMNAYQWWASSLSVSQTVANIPSGEYDLSGVVATWAGRTVAFSGNESSVTTDGQGDGTGIKVTLPVTVTPKSRLTITAGSTGQWWVEGHEGETQTFFKLDDVQLKCRALFLDGLSLRLPNDETTLLVPNQWYYYDVEYSSEFILLGNLSGLVYSTDGGQILSNVSTASAQRQMTLSAGRTYFKTTAADATLFITPYRAVSEGTFTAVALNVDGLPNSVIGIELNPDGPGADGTKKISSYLASKGYDIIGCSEDFNYNGSLMESLNDNYSCGTIRKTLSVGGVLGGFPFDTDGLNLIWKNEKVSASNESWTRWNETTSTDGNQYVKKGFRHYDVRLDGNALIDVYILHMDAGDTNATGSRHSQWEQLCDAINAADATRPKLIIGDTNSRWTREDIGAHFMNRLDNDLTASDVWVEFYRNGVCPTTDMADLTDQSNATNYSNYEIVDKIIYVNPKAANTVQLVPQSFRIEQDYTYEDGTTPLGDHRPVVVEFKWTKSGDALNMPVTLADDADNAKAIANVSDVVADVTLHGRTLIKDGAWNTLCLPFSMTAEQVTAQLTPAALMELDIDGTYEDHKTGLDGTTLYLNFKTAESIQAGTPYIIKWNKANDYEGKESDYDIANPVFRGVTVLSGSAAEVSSADGSVTFHGTFAPVALSKDNKTNLYMDADNTLSYPSIDNFKVNAFRAYFHLPDPNAAARFVLNFFDGQSGEAEQGDGTTTGIKEIDNSTIDNSPSAAAIYTLQGRPVGSSPLRKGIYISAGKTIIKR